MSKQTVSCASPNAFCSAHAVLGMRLSGVIVATRQTPISSGRTPARSSAMRAASVQSCACVSFPQICRLRMPVRDEIHASDVSVRLARSSLVTTRAGTQCPQPRSFTPLMRLPPGAARPSCGISPSAAPPAPVRSCPGAREAPPRARGRSSRSVLRHSAARRPPAPG